MFMLRVLLPLPCSTQALTLVHWSACAFYFMAMLHDFDEGTWIYAQFGDQNESRTPNLKR